MISYFEKIASVFYLFIIFLLLPNKNTTKIPMVFVGISQWFYCYMNVTFLIILCFLIHLIKTPMFS
jgi:hypothetical protein